jgi:hypothetical protein
MSQGCCGEKNDCCCSGGGSDAPVVSTSLSFKDVLGAWKARWGVGRMDYKVEPGLYSVGKPDGDSPVLVSANYKLSFDALRKNLSGLDCRLLVLDTKGINVWCAAGKGTFGTDELVNRIEETGLSEIVTQRKLILPQLGAPSVSAHEVARRTGFNVVYGPVRASDIKAYISSGCKATKDMRTVKFTFWDRLVLTPIELVAATRYKLPIFGVLFLINLFAARQFAVPDVVAYIGAVLMGAFFTPVLLPHIPGKAFSLKGWILGICWTAFAALAFGWFASGNRLLAAGYLLLLPSLSAFLALNFTGCSTFTSPSGVLKEMKIAMPLIVVSSIAGMALILTKTFWG